MSCTHDCGCSAETRDARTDDWGHTSPLSPQNADLREFQPAEPSQPLGTTRDQAARDAETDIWPTKKRVLLADVIAKAADGMGLTSSLLARPGPSEPADASEALRDVPPAERPSEALPRPITPEDVRVGMVVERRKGEAAHRDRVHLIDGERIVGINGAWLWLPGHADIDGTTLWLVEDAPEPVGPDAELVERMAEAMWRIEENPPTDYAGAIDDPEGWQELARAALLALRETHVVTPRAEQ